MKRQTLAMVADQNSGFEQFRKPTRRDEFLATMDAIKPWAEMCAVVEPIYPKGVGGRPPVGLERMRRIHFIPHGFDLADLAGEEALYDSASLRLFVGVDLGKEPVPDATTMLKFRRLLHDNQMGEQMFAKVSQVLQASGFKLKTETIVGATVIGAPSSSKNKERKSDPEIHQSRKGQQWYFGMKLCISEWTARAGWRTARWSRRLTFTTSVRCPTCCMALSGVSTATALMRASRS